MFEPSNAKAGDFEVDTDIAPRVIYPLNFTTKRESDVVAEHGCIVGLIEILENHLLRLVDSSCCHPMQRRTVLLRRELTNGWRAELEIGGAPQLGEVLDMPERRAWSRPQQRG